MDLLDGVPVALGGTRGFPVTRTLPGRRRRTVGAWCFLDAYGPHDVAGTPGMRVAPHPHTGLQTVSWLLSGEILHRDSLGNTQPIRPGRLNLMTAGRGISHAEESTEESVEESVEEGTESVVEKTAPLHGVQLWVALPHATRDIAPAFDHHADLPVLVDGGLRATILMGSLAGVTSPARCHTPLLGAELTLAAGATATIPLDPRHEYAVLTLDGEVTVDAAVPVPPGPLLHLGEGRTELTLTAGPASRLMLIGGEPFEERLVMWWNFVGREHDEIVQMRADWADGTPRFGTVRGYDGAPLPAPEMPSTRLMSRGRTP